MEKEDATHMDYEKEEAKPLDVGYTREKEKINRIKRYSGRCCLDVKPNIGKFAVGDDYL